MQPNFISGETPLLEYPRPQFQRDSYFSLNGVWEYAMKKTSQAFDGNEIGAVYDGKIVVPYSPESKLSGVEQQLKKDETLFYRRVFTLPENFKKDRVILNFGAVDQVCKVFINGEFVGEHEGGYLPFAVDITSVLKSGENVLTVTAQDDADSEIYGRGKQKYKRGGIWYTATSGIWQSVWIESVPNGYLKGMKLTPCAAEKTLNIRLETETDGSKNPFKIVVKDGDTVIEEKNFTEKEITLFLPNCKPWTTENPELYSLTVYCGEDKVQSYFGLRDFSRARVGEFQRFTLNGKPIFHNGLLDQGYWREGLYTPPSNCAMYEEIKAVKSLGFNMLRKHIKIEPALWYYYCDILGVLVWQDFINGGGAYKQLRIMLAPFINLHLNDKNYASMRRNEASRKWFYKEAYGTVDTLYNCVSLCLFTPFNEAWGQFDALKTWEMMKAYDKTRLYDHASGWQDMGGGDVCSKHIYFRKAKLKNDGKRVLALTEFGGYSLAVEGHTFSKKKFGYKTFRSASALLNAYEKLYDTEILPQIQSQGLCGTVYTELTDIEDEVNGLFTFDRVLKVDGEKLKEINGRLYAAFEKSVEKA